MKSAIAKERSAYHSCAPAGAHCKHRGIRGMVATWHSLRRCIWLHRCIRLDSRQRCIAARPHHRSCSRRTAGLHTSTATAAPNHAHTSTQACALACLHPCMHACTNACMHASSCVCDHVCALACGSSCVNRTCMQSASDELLRAAARMLHAVLCNRRCMLHPAWTCCTQSPSWSPMIMQNAVQMPKFSSTMQNCPWQHDCC